MNRMQLFSTFENNTFLEIAITMLEKNGIKQENIFAVPLDNRQEERKYLIHFIVQTVQPLLI